MTQVGDVKNKIGECHSDTTETVAAVVLNAEENPRFLYYSSYFGIGHTMNVITTYFA